VGCLLVVAAFTVNVRAESLEEIMDKISKASESLKSFSATSKTVMEMSQPGYSMTTTIDGTIEMMHKGDKYLYRSEGDSVSETDMGGTKSKQVSKNLMINDGMYSYTLSETDGVKTAYKTKTPETDNDPMAVWKASAELKALPDSSVDGHAVWVIEASPKGPYASQQGKSMLYFQKDSGQLIKMVAHTPDGKPMSTTTMTDIKVNGGVSESRFEFKAPAGVTVQEM
jgi:outer membrane lipoprotein-sorting protein